MKTFLSSLLIALALVFIITPGVYALFAAIFSSDGKTLGMLWVQYSQVFLDMFNHFLGNPIVLIQGEKYLNTWLDNHFFRQAKSILSQEQILIIKTGFLNGAAIQLILGAIFLLEFSLDKDE